MSKVPGLVVEMPFGDERLAFIRQRSIVDRLIHNNKFLVSTLHDKAPNLSITEIISGRKECNRFEQILPHVSQIVVRTIYNLTLINLSPAYLFVTFSFDTMVKEFDGIFAVISCGCGKFI